MTARLEVAAAVGVVLLACSVAWSQVEIEELDRPQKRPDAGQADASSTDAARAFDAGLVIERGTGWGALGSNMQTEDTRTLAFEALRQILTSCLADTADPREADITFRYEMSTRANRVDARLLDMNSNPEIHIDRFTLWAAGPVPSGGALWVEPQADRFRSCLGGFTFRISPESEERKTYCMTGRARFGAADLLIQSTTWAESTCPDQKAPK